jgi:TetR/AcrR family transcriptional regulator, transcriptional repressor for nem operon
VIGLILDQQVQNVNQEGAAVPRPRSFLQADVVEAAKNTFWEEGFERTTVADLERSTGLNRSSMYLAFGAKRGLFELALDMYGASFIDPLLLPMERRSAGLAEIAGFFSNLRAFFLEGPGWQRGCLLVNTIGELAGRDEVATDRAADYRNHLRRAFTHALEGAARGGGTEASIGGRAQILAATTLGVWLCARIDPIDAAALCQAIVSEIDTWRLPATDDARH